MSVEFLVTALVVCLIPGTGVIYTLSVALGRGFGASVVAAFGCTLGIVPHIAASLMGLAALLHASALLYEVVRYLGVLYLLWMAVSMLRSGGLSVSAERKPAGAGRLIADGILLNVLNPKLTLFFVAFLPQFVGPDAAMPAVFMVGLAVTFMTLTFGTFVLYGAAAALVRDAVVRRPAVVAWVNRGFAAAFGLLGLRLALAER